jgi:hypothetical protein
VPAGRTDIVAEAGAAPAERLHTKRRGLRPSAEAHGGGAAMDALLAWLNPLFAWFGFLAGPIGFAQDYLKPVHELLGVALAVAAVGLAAARLFKGWAFLARYDGRLFGYMRALPRFWLAFRADPKGSLSANAARLLVEFEILVPPPEKPQKEFPSAPKPRRRRQQTGHRRQARRQRRLARLEWRIAMKKWRDDRKRELKKLVDKIKSAHDDQARSANERSSLTTKDNRLESLPTIQLANPAKIDKSREKISRYFSIAKQFGGSEFLSYVRMNDGYLAPLFLISGLMTRFASDWEPIINNYREQLEDLSQVPAALRQRASFAELRELQSFEFICWLLWGPSVPLCSCDRWQTRHGKDHSTEDPILYQYGFGDENNSIDVRVMNGRSREFIDKVQPRLLQVHDASAPQSAPYVCAAPLSLIGQIGQIDDPTIAGEHLCEAQRIVGHKKHGRLLLTLDNEGFVSRTRPSSNYYSAYIWLMFVLENENGEPLYGTARWKNLLPFFEHGNIADATTMNTLKQCLAMKACSALREILNRGDPITIRYACAFDDANHTHKGLFEPPPRSIYDLLKDAVRADPVLAAAYDDETGRLRLPRGHKDNPFAACHLPQIVREFYELVDREN